MPAPGGAPGMGGMSPPSGEISEHVAKMMGNSQGGGSGSSGTSGVGSTGGFPGAGQLTPAQIAQAQQMMGQQAGGVPGTEAGANGALPSAGPAVQPREVGTIADEAKRGFSDIFKGIKEFFSINTWLGINPNKLDPAQEAHAKQLHSRYQQLDQEQQAVARRMYEEKMQKKRAQQQEEERKKQMEAEQQAQSVVVPSGPKKGAEGPGGGKSKKQNVLTKLKQDRTTLNNTQGE
ncbi:hypothetical protein KA017_02435 [Candidatus Woesebacteria bacterium]|nr:hypothetical protein [Candidatus Woesebacteria bacterium]